MKISGTATVHAAPAKVWMALNDPAVLARTIPGCDHLEVTAPGSCRLTVTAAVAPVRGTYTGEVSLIERHEPTSFRFAAHSAGGPGTVSTTMLVQLTTSLNGNTHITYDADAEPSGTIAAIGQRLLASAANKMAGEFFASVDEVLMVQAAPGPGRSSVGEPRPSAAPPPGVRPPTGSFQQGVLVGAAAALAAMIVARRLRRRPR